MKKNKIIFILAGCLVFIIITWASVSCYKNEIINGGLFVSTVALVVIAYIQLDSLKIQANADFLLNVNRDFFYNDSNRNIIETLEESKPLLKETGGQLNLYQIDDYIGYFELLRWYEKRGLIEFELIDDTFGHYISVAWKNKEIKNYIEKLREETKDSRYYDGFENLAKRVIAIEEEVRKNISKR